MHASKLKLQRTDDVTHTYIRHIQRRRVTGYETVVVGDRAVLAFQRRPVRSSTWTRTMHDMPTRRMHAGHLLAGVRHGVRRRTRASATGNDHEQADAVPVYRELHAWFTSARSLAQVYVRVPIGSMMRGWAHHRASMHHRSYAS
jgi:hypothetical protein